MFCFSFFAYFLLCLLVLILDSDYTFSDAKPSMFGSLSLVVCPVLQQTIIMCSSCFYLFLLLTETDVIVITYAHAFAVRMCVCVCVCVCVCACNQDSMLAIQMYKLVHVDSVSVDFTLHYIQ